MHEETSHGAQRGRRRIGIGLGRIGQWHDGIGEFVQRFAEELAGRAVALRASDGWDIVYHLPRRWHGRFGDAVAYLDVLPRQRWLHHQPAPFDLWHNVHLRSRVAAPNGTRRRVETVHDLIFLHQAKNALQAAQRKWAARRRLLAADAVVAISRWVGDEVARTMAPLPRGMGAVGAVGAVDVVHNGVSDGSGLPQQPVAGLDGVPFLLHISRMTPNKNVGALLELAAAWPEQAFVFAGQRNAHTLAVERAVAELAERGIGRARVLFDVDEATKRWLYAHCSGFLFPSFDEGFGLPPVEAMYFGKPAFLSRLTALPEVGGAVAHYFDRFDAASMRRVVESGLAAAAAPGAAAAIRAHAQRFDWERCVDGYVAIYRRLLAR